MKKQTLLLAVVMIGTAAHADLGRKAPLKADFHSMIVDSQQERNGLAKGVTKSIVHNKATKSRTQNDQNRVTDFVDVEIGWGEAPQMVDRRFDSVGAPVLALPEIEDSDK